MEELLPYYDVASYLTHETEDDCHLIIRTNNGRVIYCYISPSEFQASPGVTEQYFKCLHLLRSGEEEIDDFYEEDMWEWFSKSFEPLIAQLAPSTLPPTGDGQPTLSHYLYAPYFVCTLKAAEEVLQPRKLDTQDHGWSSRVHSTGRPRIPE